MNKGILYGVSVGPGDPELLTLKAIKIIDNTNVIAAPVTSSGQMLALDIVKQSISLKGKTILPLKFAMSKDSSVLSTSHHNISLSLEEYLAKNQDVALLNLGDASLYSTWNYIRDIVSSDGYECITIPGVNSFSAVAALTEKSLTHMHDLVTIIPGGNSDLEIAINTPGTKIIMKSASALPAIKKTLYDKGITNIVAVRDCGLSTQEIYYSLDDIPEDGHYFITILVL